MSSKHSNYNKIKLIGEIMACDGAMEIMRYIAIEPQNIRKISKKLSMRDSLVIHHIQRMVQLDLVERIENNVFYKNSFKINKKIKHIYLTKPGVLEKIEELA